MIFTVSANHRWEIELEHCLGVNNSNHFDSSCVERLVDVE